MPARASSTSIDGSSDAHLAADVQDRLPVVLELAACVINPMTRHDRSTRLRDGPAVILLHPRRNRNPHQIERARELRAEIGDARRAPALPLDAFFVEDRGAVIERVEQLREAKRVLRQDGELQRSHHLFDNLVEAGRLEHQPPQPSVARR